MEYRLQPLLVQQTNWNSYIEIYKDLFGDSPTRILDKMSVSLDSPKAFPKTLQEYFDGNHLRHSIFSFIGSANADMLLEIQNRTEIKILSKESTEERGIYIFIATADIEQWRLGLKELEKCNKNLQTFSQNCLTFLKMAGYNL